MEKFYTTCWKTHKFTNNDTNWVLTDIEDAYDTWNEGDIYYNKPWVYEFTFNNINLLSIEDPKFKEAFPEYDFDFFTEIDYDSDSDNDILDEIREILDVDGLTHYPYYNPVEDDYNDYGVLVFEPVRHASSIIDFTDKVYNTLFRWMVKWFENTEKNTYPLDPVQVDDTEEELAKYDETITVPEGVVCLYGAYSNDITDEKEFFEWMQEVFPELYEELVDDFDSEYSYDSGWFGSFDDMVEGLNSQVNNFVEELEKAVDKNHLFFKMYNYDYNKEFENIK